MDYLKVYRAIVERGQVREPDPDGYYEVHHIQPRCMGGGDERGNLTTLTAREHYISHWLLARIYPEHSGVIYSFFCMTIAQNQNRKRNYLVSSRAYAEAREMYSKEVSKNGIFRKNIIIKGGSVSKADFANSEISGIMQNKVVVKDKKGNRFSVEKDDPRLISGEIEPYRRGAKNTEEGNKKRSETLINLKFTGPGQKMFTPSQVQDIQREYKSGLHTYKSLCQKWGCSRKIIHTILKGSYI